MAGRRRFQVTARAGNAAAQAIEAQLSAAVAAHGPSIHAVDSPVRRGPSGESSPPADREEVVSLDLRVLRSVDSDSVRQPLRGISRPGSEVVIVEHECFHGLRDEPDYRLCTDTLSLWVSVDGGPGQGRDNG